MNFPKEDILRIYHNEDMKRVEVDMAEWDNESRISLLFALCCENNDFAEILFNVGMRLIATSENYDRHITALDMMRKLFLSQAVGNQSERKS